MIGVRFDEKEFILKIITNSNYDNSSFYIIHHNDSHPICSSSVQLSLGPPLPVKTFFEKVAAFFS
jgi:hypothetical protein